MREQLLHQMLVSEEKNHWKSFTCQKTIVDSLNEWSLTEVSPLMSLIKRIYVNSPKIGLVTMASQSCVGGSISESVGRWHHSFGVSGFVRDFYKFTNQT